MHRPRADTAPAKAPRSGGRVRKLAGVLAALGLGLLTAVVAGELWARSLTPAELGFEYEDGVFHRPSEFTPATERNKHGHHDVEPREKAEGERRVLLLGDSYVAALSVPIDQIVGKQLERALLETRPERWDVVSVGRPGWGQEQELAGLRREGAELHPDLVVTLFLSLNDLRNDSRELQGRSHADKDQIQQMRPGWMEFSADEAPLLLCRSSVLNRMLSHRLAATRLRTASTGIPTDYLVYRTERDEAWQEAWRHTQELLLATRDEAAALGARYAIVSASTPQGVLGAEAGLEVLLREYPAMRAWSWDLDQVDRWLAQFCDANAIPFLALEPIFRRLQAEQGLELHWPINGHWNAAGNAAAGREIAAFLARSVLTPAPPEERAGR